MLALFDLGINQSINQSIKCGFIFRVSKNDIVSLVLQTR